MVGHAELAAASATELIACQAQLVNVLGLIRSEEGGDAWKQSIAYPFEQMRRLASGQILRVAAQGDRYDSAEFTDAGAGRGRHIRRGGGRSAVFLANRSQDEPVSVEIDCRGLPMSRAAPPAACRYRRSGSVRHQPRPPRHAGPARAAQCRPSTAVASG